MTRVILPGQRVEGQKRTPLLIASNVYKAERLKYAAFTSQIMRDALSKTEDECREEEEDRRNSASAYADWRASV